MLRLRLLAEFALNSEPRAMKHIGNVLHRQSRVRRLVLRRRVALKPSVEFSGVVSNGNFDSPLNVVWPDNGGPVKKIDWSPLAGRTVIFHPEHDASKELGQ